MHVMQHVMLYAELLKTKFHDSPEVYQLSVAGKDGRFRHMNLLVLKVATGRGSCRICRGLQGDKIK